MRRARRSARSGLADDRPGQAVDGIVGDAHRVLVVIVGDHGQHRPEDLLLRDAHVVGRRRRRSSARRSSRAAAARGGRRRIPGARPRACRSRCTPARAPAAAALTSGPMICPGPSGSPYGSCANAARRNLDALRVACPRHQQPRRDRAALAGVVTDREAGEQRAAEIRIIQHDGGGLAAELQEHPLHRRGGVCHDAPADGGRAGEGRPCPRAHR